MSGDDVLQEPTCDENVSKIRRVSIACLLRVIATAFVVAFPIGMLGFGLMFAVSTVCDLATHDPTGGLVMLTVAHSVAWGWVLLPIGVVFHWLIARRTCCYPTWVWATIFVSSVLLALIHFPNGTVSGVVAIGLLYGSGTFRKMKKRVRVFR